MIRSLITAFRTLTILPLPGKDTALFSSSLIFFPVVGAFLAVCEYGIMVAGSHYLIRYPGVTAFILVVAGIVFTGAIHCDGLADFCDGFFGGKTKEQILLIMKDPRKGTFGVIALILDLGSRFLLYFILLDEKAFYVIAFSLVISRIMQAVSIAFLPYARPQGGTAAPFSQGKYSRLVSILLIIATFLIALGFFPPMAIATLFTSGTVITTIFLILCKKKIGGITGDCIGACNELVETGVLFAGLFLLPV
jgi:adenosylcobinamide-GDP ribazoletransferase